MMGVYVKGMKTPENCIECMSSGLRTAIKCTEWTKISAGRRENERAWSCPLVDLGKHGRLIDADKCEDYFWEHLDDNGMAVAIVINDMPTIIEAEDRS